MPSSPGGDKREVVQAEKATHEKQDVPFSESTLKKSLIFEYQDLTEWLKIDEKWEGSALLKDALRVWGG